MRTSLHLLQTVLCALFLLTPASRAHAADAPHTPRVLIVNSFGSRAPPFTTHSTAFETTLTREMGTRVDLDEVSLDQARFAQPEMEEAIAELLLKRLSKWQPDLVVAFGSPAGRFVANYRQRLFPSTPIVYDGMDKSRLPPNAFQNAAFVGTNFDLKELVQDILLLKPDTNHIVVILGATPLERYWASAFDDAFQQFSGRVRFTYVNDLSFEQMLDLVSTLPPRSFVLLGLLLRDASGVTHNSSDALVRLNAVTAAPINGIYQHELGLGLVGGRLYQGELEGSEGARVAIRILRGEAASSIPPKIIGPALPKYDWRELRRWKIPESRLPPGSIILFRQPTLWERYQIWIIIALLVIALQSGLIVALIVQRRRRRRAQEALRRHRDELAHVSRVTAMGELTASLAHELSQPLLATMANAESAQGILSDQPCDLNEMRQIMSDILDDNKRATEIIRRIRSLLKKEKPQFASLDLAAATREIARLLHADALSRGVRISVDIPSDLPRAWGVRVQVQQVLLNLVLNAFEAMRECTASDRHALIRAAVAEDGMLTVSVRDQGTGLSPESLRKLFEPFFTTKSNGLGMGLSISRSIIHSHGGRLWGENNVDRGATFHFTIPRERPDQKQSAHTPAATDKASMPAK